MEKRDYLLRQIEALRQILSRLRELITGGATAQADSQIRDEMRNVGLDLATANALDPATVLMLLGSPVLDCRRAFGVATLMDMDALRARADGDESRAARSVANALALIQAAKPMLDGERADLAANLIEELRATSPTA
jgi:hypothetical protein